MVAPGGHVWLLQGEGGMRGCSGGRGACVVAPRGGHAWDMTRYGQIRRYGQ